MRATTLFWFVLSVVASTGLAAACATEGESDPIEPPSREVPLADAENIADSDGSATDAGQRPCSASKLCIAAVPVEPNINLLSVWGSSATDVWAVGSGGTVLHYDGVAWEKAARAAPTDASYDVTLRGIWLERPDDVWIVGGSSIRHATGWKGPSETEWSFIMRDGPASCEPAAVRGAAGALWVAEGLRLVDDQCWRLARFEGWDSGAPDSGAPEVLPKTVKTIPRGFASTSLSIAVAGSDEVWVTGTKVSNGTVESRVFRVDLAVDGGWQAEEYDGRTLYSLPGVWAGEHAIWLGGEAGTLRRLDRDAVSTKRFEIVSSPVDTDLYGMFGFGADDVWAVGEASTVLHWDGTTWTKLSTPFDEATDKPRLHAVWGSSPGDVWIAGDRTMLHYEVAK